MCRYLTLLGLLFLCPPLLAGPAADFDLAEERVTDGDLRAALDIYEQLAADHPDNADYLLELGRTQLAMNRALPASRTLREVTELDPDREAAYRLLRQAYYASGQSEQAYAVIQEARERFGDRPWLSD
ncbi:putative Zn-dependent protease [Methylohalomonas lacus]|uniref:Zn-dependent protease n=1 Tax=Methylohalomonas lacus TaxID=398773 RepID=A0AAE3HLE5_9GAMM|nr:tetratricopeptide repeat protein [Methylohalomonas lacus]MCS3903127.1 putative Zn-dependent protease [Methylohalomonas lacus]